MKTTKPTFMERKSTTFLRCTIVFLGLIVLLLCVFALPNMYNGGSAEFPWASRMLLAIIGILYVTTIPFFIALWQGLLLLRYIDKGTAFSMSSVKALRIIKWCAITITILYLACMPLLFIIIHSIADEDDAPGLPLFGAILACAPLTIAVFASLLQKLLQNAIDIKSENDLTI